MKIIYEFDSFNIDDQELRKTMDNAGAMEECLIKIFSKLRYKLKYEELTQEEFQTIEKLRDEFREICDEYHLEL